jgi:hypothetical protein
MNTIMKETNSPPPPAGTPGPFSLSYENVLMNSFITSESRRVTVERMNVTFDFDSAEVYTSFVYETAAPLRKTLANETLERRQEILKAVTESARKYADNSTGIVKLSNEAICIVGRR